MLVGIQELKTFHLRAYGLKKIRDWARDGLIPSVRVGRKFMFDPKEVLDALKAARGSLQ